MRLENIKNEQPHPAPPLPSVCHNPDAKPKACGPKTLHGGRGLLHKLCRASFGAPHPTSPSYPPTLNALVDSAPEQHPLGNMSLWAGTLEMWAVSHLSGVV